MGTGFCRTTSRVTSAPTKRLPDLTVDDRPEGGGCDGTARPSSRQFGMKWRVVSELAVPVGSSCVQQVCGRAAEAEYAPQLIGVTLGGG